MSIQTSNRQLERTIKIIVFLGLGVACLSLILSRPWDGLSLLFIFWALDFFYRAWRHLSQIKEDEYVRAVEARAQYIALGLVAAVGLGLFWLQNSSNYWSVFGLGIVVGIVAVSSLANLISWLRLR